MRNSCLRGKGIQKIEPFFIPYEPGAMKDLQNSHDLSFRNQRPSMGADEFFTRQHNPTQIIVMLLSQIRDVDDFTLQSSPTGIAFAQGLAGMFDGIGVKTTPGYILKCSGCGVE